MVIEPVQLLFAFEFFTRYTYSCAHFGLLYIGLNLCGWNTNFVLAALFLHQG